MTIKQVFCTVAQIAADMKDGSDETRLYQSALEASRFLSEEIGWFIPVTQTTQMRGTGRDYLYPYPPILALTGSITNDGNTLTESTDFVFMRRMWANGPYLGIERLSDAPNFSAWYDGDPDSVQIPAQVGLYNATALLSATVADATGQTDSQLTLKVSDGSQVSPAMTLLLGTEQELVTGWSSPTESVTTLGAAVAITDDVITLANASLVNKGEVLRAGFEQMKVRDLRTSNNTASVIRSWNGTTKSAHLSGAAVDVYRTVTVERALNGTTAAAHALSSALYRYQVPDDILFLAKEIATLMANKAGSGYQGKVGRSDIGEVFYNDAFPQYDIERVKQNYWIGRA
jgi:hypothetical protein